MGAEPGTSTTELLGVVHVTASTVASSGCTTCGESACGEVGCSECEASGRCCQIGGHCVSEYFRQWLGPMPQTCYGPRFGCYPGNARTINRYPAFHGSYYRKPYNWRQYTEYPWHAAPHDPQRFFTMSPVPEIGGPLPTMRQPETAAVDSSPLGLPPRPIATGQAKRIVESAASSRH